MGKSVSRPHDEYWDVQLVAHHEAGHAVVARALGLTVVRVELMFCGYDQSGRSPRPLYTGQVHTRLGGCPRPARAELVLSVAGEVAEKLAEVRRKDKARFSRAYPRPASRPGEVRPDGGCDTAQAWRQAVVVACQPQPAEFSLGLLRPEPYTPCAEYVRSVVRHAEVAAADILRANWAAVARLAGGLGDLTRALCRPDVQDELHRLGEADVLRSPIGGWRPTTPPCVRVTGGRLFLMGGFWVLRLDPRRVRQLTGRLTLPDDHREWACNPRP